MKGLLNRNLLFSERMMLEKEFYEWCENGGEIEHEEEP